MPARPSPLVVVAGPSGVGKTTVVAAVLAAAPCPLRRAVTATTRGPRPGELPGVDYHYWTPERFAAAIQNDELLEYAVVHGRDHYGTPREEVTPHRLAGTTVLLVIDVQGAANVRRLYGYDALTVFVNPPSFEVLEQRLHGRGSESAERVKRRLASAELELARAAEFDCQITNGDLADAAAKLTAVVTAQRQLHEDLAMLDDLKEEEIVNKVGGRFKLSVLIQKRMVALNTGAKPLVEGKTPLDRMSVVLEEIQQDKIYLDPTGEVQTTNMTVSMNLPTPYYGGGTAAADAELVPETPEQQAAKDDE